MLSNEKRYVNTNMNSNLKHTIGSNDAQILISEEEPRNFLHVRLQRYFGQMFWGCIVLYCIVSINLYSASCSAHQSEALPVRETQREESSLERTKRCTWHTS